MQENLTQEKQKVYIKSCWKTELASLKSQVDKLDVDKLESVHANLVNLSSIVDNVTKTLYTVNRLKESKQ